MTDKKSKSYKDMLIENSAKEIRKFIEWLRKKREENVND